MTDDEIWAMKRGAHDYQKVYSAFKAAVEHKGQPTVVLAQSVKGYGLGASFEARNATHQMKKLSMEDLKQFRDHLRIPISDEELEKDLYNPPYYHPGKDSEEYKYLMARREELGSFVPSRKNVQPKITLPSDKAYKGAFKGTGKQMAATTMTFVRLLKDLMREGLRPPHRAHHPR